MDYLSEEGLQTYDAQIKGYVNAQMAQRSEIPASLMAVINDIDSHVDTMYANYVTKADLLSALANIGGGEVITINMINADENCHVEVTSGTTVIDNNVANGGTITVPFGVEYTITAYDGSMIIKGLQTTSTAMKMSSNTTIDCGVIDLGLPSGNLWANKNIGAAAPYEAGLYFSWGNVEGHAANSGYEFSSTNYGSTTGNSLRTSFTSGDPTYDAARANMGGDWRMPTRAEYKELLDNCTWTLKTSDNTDYNGVAGFEVTGTNGNKIFLPAAGYYDGVNFNHSGSYGELGLYWTTDYYYNSRAYIAYLGGWDKGTSDTSVYRGLTVRAVKTPQS